MLADRQRFARYRQPVVVELDDDVRVEAVTGLLHTLQG